jgi:hypothetical protein
MYYYYYYYNTKDWVLQEPAFRNFKTNLSSIFLPSLSYVLYKYGNFVSLYIASCLYII